MTVSSAIGRIISRQNVEQATVVTLQRVFDDYLYEIERQNGLEPRSIKRPPSDKAYYGGLDFLQVESENMPALVAVAEPYGDAEYFGSGNYTQAFELQVGAVVTDQDENATRQLADWYGAAVMAAIGQSSLDGLASRVRMVESPTTSWIDPDLRRVQHAVTSFHVFVDGIVNDLGGPPAGPGPTNVHDATSTHVQIVVVPDDETITEFDPTSENA